MSTNSQPRDHRGRFIKRYLPVPPCDCLYNARSFLEIECFACEHGL